MNCIAYMRPMRFLLCVVSFCVCVAFSLCAQTDIISDDMTTSLDVTSDCALEPASLLLDTAGDNTTNADNIGDIDSEAKLIPPVLKSIDMDMPDHPLVNRYYDQYTTDNGKKWLETVMQRGESYVPYIESKIAEYEVPYCLLYLPVIESNFVTTAVSKSGAMGLWQFMKNSIAPFNIRINDWMDERRDPWLSTDAALKKLKENYDYFGDWHLALAAYNAGLGAISRAIKQAGSNDYWYLAEKGYLKAETVQYVPKFLAVSSILINADIHGLHMTSGNTLPEFVTIDVSRPIDITLLAEKANIDVTVIKRFNPALHYNVTPAATQYALRIPAESEKTVRDILDNEADLIRYYLHTIKTGDTFYALSRHYDITIDMLQEYNSKLKPSTLQIGQKVLIPAFKDVAPYSGKKDAENLVFDSLHTVEKGETLWSISLLYNIQVETLAEKNNLGVNSILRIGMSLKVPILE